MVNLPDPISAVDMYRTKGGQLTDPRSYGVDSIANDPQKLEIQKKSFIEKFPSFDHIFNQLVNGTNQIFKEALLLYININFVLIPCINFNDQ